MSQTFDAMIRSWPTAPWLAASLLLTAGIYLRGWRQLRRRDPDRWNAGRAAAFVGGLAAIYLALASPVESFASLFLSVHMVQHLLLMMLAPPLLWLGWPLMPMVRGLPSEIRTYWIVPLLRSRPLRRLFGALTHPFAAWPLYVAITWLWHLPRGYELGLSSDFWHFVQHACFLGSAVLFWFPVIRPYPTRPHWPKWLLFPYLILADVQNTLLAAWLTFSSRLIYPHYAHVPRLESFSALSDQRVAGVLMWVPGSIAFLAPLFVIGIEYLRGEARVTARHTRHKPAISGTSAAPFDLLTLPGLGRWIGARATRRVIQVLMLILAAVIAFDGLQGPQVAPTNLAGVLPWIHWRGFVIFSLLAVGNLSCFACPVTLPRSLAGRWLPDGRRWPARLRNKWLAVGLLAAFLFSYEAFALWNSPWLTAWIVIGYFLAAFVIDTVFSVGSFCKYVCPIGQFNFVHSLVSPSEVRVRDPIVCTNCKTHDCLRGNALSPGCHTLLFQPTKVGNLDCTMCLDCTRACPHGNVGIFAAAPGRVILSERFRAMAARPDLAALVTLLVFGAFANAAGMIKPVVETLDRLRVSIGNPEPILIIAVFYGLALFLVPATAVMCAARVSQKRAGLEEPLARVASRYGYALVPLGFAMWLAHYGFHFFASWLSVIPTTQRFAADFGMPVGSPLWQCANCCDVAAWIPQFEILALDVGMLGSLYLAFRIAESDTTSTRAALKAFAPWAAIIVLLFAVGIWIIFQPMEMRGTLQSGG